MVDISFGAFKMNRVTKGIHGKFVIPSEVMVVKKEISKINLRLPLRKEQLLKQHSKHHSKRHMDYMRQIMLMGLPFKEAHKRAAQFIGR